MQRALAGFGVALVMMLAACLPVRAQGSGPQLTLRTLGGQTTFRIGERIPLELVFTGPGNGHYRIGWTGERVAGTGFDAVNVSPSGGWADPLRVLYATIGGFGGGGGLYLSAKPAIVPVDLNEWVRFDQPGTYQVVFTTRRVIALSTGGFQGKPVELRSNPIEIKIEPATAAWQKAKLAEVEAVLEQPVKKYAADSPERTAAIADLRFLGTADAASLMAKHLGADDPLAYQCAWGLMGLPEALHQTALNDLNTDIDDPEFPISGKFLETMAALQVSNGTVASMRTEEMQFSRQAWEAAFASLQSKQGKAQAETANALLGDQPAPLSEEQVRELGNILAVDLTELPVMDQAQSLQSRWNLLRSTNLLPLLEKLGTAPLKKPDYGARQLKSAALERWFDLDPEGAKQEILREIGIPNPTLMAQDLEFLPKEKLPQFEYMWAQQFAMTNDYQREAVLAGLLARFGDGEAVGLVESKARTSIEKWGCEVTGAALAYIADFDPDEALPLIQQALASAGKGQGGCSRSLFESIDQYATAPVLTKAASEAVANSDPLTVMDAATYLTEYGDASAKSAILNRFEAWSQKWRGRVDELKPSEPGQLPDNWGAISLGRTLIRALLAGQGWLATPGLFAEVKAGCADEQVCQEIEGIEQQSGRQPYLILAIERSGTDCSFQIAQYSIRTLDLLDAKVAQFPRGTRFTIPEMQGFDGIDVPKLTNKLKAILAKHGMVLVQPRGILMGSISG